jgi:hypothetical protein
VDGTGAITLTCTPATNALTLLAADGTTTVGGSTGNCELAQTVASAAADFYVHASGTGSAFPAPYALYVLLLPP